MITAMETPEKQPSKPEKEILLSFEKKNGFFHVDVLSTKKGNPFNVKIDRVTGMMQFVQINEGVIDEVHMNVLTFAALVKGFGMEQLVDGSYKLTEVGVKQA
jgi:NADH:ubiquinone oxidoreductase subunit D